MEFALALLALTYSGLVLFVLAYSLRKVFPPMRAALTGFAISVALHLFTTLLMGEHMLLALAFWGVPHLLVLPLLLWAAKRQAEVA